MTSPVCVVTGASGFIGRSLCAHLREKGWHVRRFLHGAMGSSGGDFFGDITDTKTLRPAMAGVDIVFHLAGIAHTAGRAVGLYQQVNVVGSDAVARAAAECGVQRVVFFSSSQVEAAEDGRLPLTPYIKSKQQAEHALQRRANGSPGFELCILRPAHVYGMGMKGGIASMLRLIQSGRLPRLPKLPGRLSMIGIADLCELATRAAVSEQAAGKTLPLADGRIYAVNEIENQIYQALGRQPRGYCPAVILLIAAVMAEVMASPLNWLRPGNFGFGMGSYRALVSDQTVDSTAAHKLLGSHQQQSVQQPTHQSAQETQQCFEDFLRAYFKRAD